MIKVKIGDQEYECQWSNELAMNEETINEDLKKQPSLYAWYAILGERAEEQLDNYKTELDECKLALEVKEAEIDISIRSKNEKGMTEKKLHSLILLTPEYQKARMMVINAQRKINGARMDMGILKKIAKSYDHRKDMLIALSTNMRAQADPSIYVKKRGFQKKDGDEIPY